MVNRERMVSTFIQLALIDSLSKKEREIADELKKIFDRLDLPLVEDKTGIEIGGNAGNLLCTFKGSKNVPAILLTAHMDTVEPGTRKRPQFEDGYLKADGKSILGGDDIAGIVCIMEAIMIIQERNLPHGDIQILFTVAEEIGCLGSKNLDYDKIYAQYGIIMDSGGPVGGFVISAPAQNNISVVIKGKAAHAGVEPEKGINAIQIAAEAISNGKWGRIDDETTSNVGIINGGTATNILCDLVEIKAEIRSRDQDKLDEQTVQMAECFQKAASLYGGSVHFKSELSYPAYCIAPHSSFLKILSNAAKSIGVDFMTGASGGGSDANIINARGIVSVDMCLGMDKVHSVEEQILIDDMIKAADLLVAIITSME